MTVYPGKDRTDHVTRHKENKKGKILTMETTLKIEGMMCTHCEASVRKALLAVENVEAAEVSHEAGTAKVKMSAAVPFEVLKKAVEDKDYKVTGTV